MTAKEMSVMSPDELGARVKAHIKAGDKEFALGERHRIKADDHYRSAGIHLIDLKKTFQLESQKTRGLWGDYAKKLAGVGQERADVLIRLIGKTESEIEDIKKNEAERQRLLRKKSKSVGRTTDYPTSPSVPVPYSPPEPEPPLIPHDPESDSEEEIRVRGFMWRAAESKRYANFDDLSGIEISAQAIEVASAAADAWSALLSKLKGVHNGQEVETQIHEALPA